MDIFYVYSLFPRAAVKLYQGLSYICIYMHCLAFGKTAMKSAFLHNRKTLLVLEIYQSSSLIFLTFP